MSMPQRISITERELIDIKARIINGAYGKEHVADVLLLVEAYERDTQRAQMFSSQIKNVLRGTRFECLF